MNLNETWMYVSAIISHFRDVILCFAENGCGIFSWVIFTKLYKENSHHSIGMINAFAKTINFNWLSQICTCLSCGFWEWPLLLSIFCRRYKMENALSKCLMYRVVWIINKDKWDTHFPYHYCIYHTFNRKACKIKQQRVFHHVWEKIWALEIYMVKLIEVIYKASVIKYILLWQINFVNELHTKINLLIFIQYFQYNSGLPKDFIWVKKCITS